MRVAPVVCPFKQTFRRLELEKHWWHRLSFVLFSVILLGAAAFAAWVTYSAFAPQVATMPDIQVVDISSGLVRIDPATGERIAPTQQAIDYDALAKQYGGIPVQPMIDQQYMVHQIPMDKVIDALEAGDQRVVDMYDPKGKRGWIPEAQVQAAIKSGFTIAKPVAPDFSKVQPLNKSIQMPDGSTSRFGGTVSDDAIKSQWNHAKTAQTWKAICWAGLFTIVVALFVNYFLQGAYRALLYVMFGSKTQAA